MADSDKGVTKYEPTWESLQNYEVPDWFKDVKFGIFIHWGPYAVPAFGNEWYPNHMYRKGSAEYEHHRKTYGPQAEFGYKDFVPMFKAEHWDPDAWIDLFKRAGAKYVVPVGEHHDGFPMYACSFTNWNAALKGPCRDVCAELADACRREGLYFGISSHRAHNWNHFTFPDGADTSDPDARYLYGDPHLPEAPVSYEFVLDWYERTKEMVDKFSPDILWFDFGWHRDEFAPWWPRLAAYYYNHALEHGYEPILQYKARFPDGTAVLDLERSKLDDIREECWQTDTAVSYKSWGYIEGDDFKSVTSMVHDLVDIVSKNGNLLMNIGPRADGIIPDEAADLLLGIGKWLEVNGEAIYGTRHWEKYGEGAVGIPKNFAEKEQAAYSAEDIRFTTKGGVLYATALGWPGEQLAIKSLGSASSVKADSIARITMLGDGGELPWTQDEAGLTVTMPSAAPCEHAVTLKIERK